jgi:hypothetical protein
MTGHGMEDGVRIPPQTRILLFADAKSLLSIEYQVRFPRVHSNRSMGMIVRLLLVPIFKTNQGPSSLLQTSLWSGL